LLILVIVLLQGTALADEYIILYKHKPCLQDKMVIRSYGGKIKREYHVINAMLVDLPKNAVEKIKKLKNVVAVEPNVIVHAYGFANYTDTIPWNIQDIKANLVWNSASPCRQEWITHGISSSIRTARVAHSLRSVYPFFFC